MEVFEPKSFSTDWEIMVFDRQNRLVGNDKLCGIAGTLRQELNLPIQIDWRTVECALGVNRSFAEIRDKAVRVTDRLTNLLAEYSLDPCPAASDVRDGQFNASHVHVGTLTDEAAGVRLEADMIRYVPALAALAANSPVTGGRPIEYKSERVRRQAFGCTRPASVRDPQLAQPTWGADAAPKLFGAATFEVRVLDCASSRLFLAELATLVAAYVHYRSRRISGTPPSPESFERSSVNRWLAAKHGLQATLLWDDGPRPVVDVLDEMIDACSAELAELGASRKDLALINSMLKKRVCQADYVLDLARRYPENWVLASVMIKTLRHWDTFDSYLNRAPALEPVPAPTRADILDEHLALIGEGTHFYVTRDAMNLPPTAADAIIDELIEQGRIRTEVGREGGKLLSRM